MSKKLWFQLVVIPQLRTLAAWLRVKDADNVGGDDEAAEAMEYALARLEKYFGSGE